MAKFEKVLNYINNVKIKKTFFGGYDRDDVYMKMNEIVDIFKEYMKEEREEQESQRKEIEAELEKQKQKMNEYKMQLCGARALVEELNEKIDLLEAEKTSAEEEKDKMKVIYKKYCSDILQQYSESLHTLSSEFASALDNITKLQQKIVDMEKLQNLEELDLNIAVIEEKEGTALPDSEINEEE